MKSCFIDSSTTILTEVMPILYTPVVGAACQQFSEIYQSCGDEPDLKQIFSKHSEYSILITEYIERCNGFEGFFTKSNVAALTEAAGLDERYEHGHVFD